MPSLDHIKEKIGDYLRKIHQTIAKVGKAKHAAFLIVATIPEKSDEDFFASVGFAGNPEIISQAVKKRMRADPDFLKFMEYLIDDFGEAESKEELDKMQDDDLF